MALIVCMVGVGARVYPSVMDMILCQVNVLFIMLACFNHSFYVNMFKSRSLNWGECLC